MGQQRINWKKWIGLLMGLAGVAILTAA